MSNSETVGPENIHIEVLKILRDRGIESLTKFYYEIMRPKQILDEHRNSEKCSEDQNRCHRSMQHVRSSEVEETMQNSP